MAFPNIYAVHSSLLPFKLDHPVFLFACHSPHHFPLHSTNVMLCSSLEILLYSFSPLSPFYFPGFYSFPGYIAKPMDSDLVSTNKRWHVAIFFLGLGYCTQYNMFWKSYSFTCQIHDFIFSYCLIKLQHAHTLHYHPFFSWMLSLLLCFLKFVNTEEMNMTEQVFL